MQKFCFYMTTGFRNFPLVEQTLTVINIHISALPIVLFFRL